jgi:hypothetical protein
MNNLWFVKEGRPFQVQLTDSYWTDNGDEFILRGSILTMPVDLLQLLNSDPFGVYQIGPTLNSCRSWRLYRTAVGGFAGIIELHGRRDSEPYQCCLSELYVN